MQKLDISQNGDDLWTWQAQGMYKESNLRMDKLLCSLDRSEAQGLPVPAQKPQGSPPVNPKLGT